MARFSPGLQNAINNLMSGHGTPLRLNPAGRTIEARRSGTCPISGEPISPGDSITKTDAGWVLTKHAGAAMENPRTFRGAQSAERRAQPSKETKRRQAQNESLKDYLREYDPGFRERPRLRQSKTFSTRVGGNLVLQHEKELKSMMPDLSLPAIRKMSPEQVVEALDKRGVMHPEFEGFAMHHFQREYNNPYYENPGMGGKAMKYARTHGMSLKEGWAAVKAGKSNPATPSSGPSASSLIRKAKDHDLFGVPRSPTKVDFHSDSGYDGMGGAYIGSVSVNGDIVTFVGFEPPGKSFAVKILNPRKATAAIVDVADALNAGYDDLAATVTEFADGVLQLVGESGLSNPYFENGMGGSAMKYAKKHGVSLKQGWAAVKAGRS